MNDYTMQINGLFAAIHMPNAPQGNGVYGLPPAEPQRVYKVDEYPACPTNWMNGSDIASSYFVPIATGKHLWLDFNMNIRHQHHVAVVMSVQGINPITGQPTTQLRLEQYRTNCPIHNAPFKQDRFCEQCGYMWPAQNYLTTVSVPSGLFWIDGFRAQNGEIRGFLTTEETARGVATQLIGDNRVFAIGMAFYLSKEPKPKPVIASLSRSSSGQFHKYLGAAPASNKWESANSFSFDGNMKGGYSGGGHTLSSSGHYGSEPAVRSCSFDTEQLTSSIMGASAGADEVELMACDVEPGPITDVKKLEIGAGARIQQELSYFDPSEPSFYQDTPIGMIYLNYVDVKDFERIIKAGKRDLTKKGEGFMAGLVAGNP